MVEYHHLSLLPNHIMHERIFPLGIFISSSSFVLFLLSFLFFNLLRSNQLEHVLLIFISFKFPSTLRSLTQHAFSLEDSRGSSSFLSRDPDRKQSFAKDTIILGRVKYDINIYSFYLNVSKRNSDVGYEIPGRTTRIRNVSLYLCSSLSLSRRGHSTAYRRTRRSSSWKADLNLEGDSSQEDYRKQIISVEILLLANYYLGTLAVASYATNVSRTFRQLDRTSLKRN